MSCFSAAWAWRLWSQLATYFFTGASVVTRQIDLKKLRSDVSRAINPQRAMATRPTLISCAPVYTQYEWKIAVVEIATTSPTPAPAGIHVREQDTKFVRHGLNQARENQNLGVNRDVAITSQLVTTPPSVASVTAIRAGTRGGHIIAMNRSFGRQWQQLLAPILTTTCRLSNWHVILGSSSRAGNNLLGYELAEPYEKEKE